MMLALRNGLSGVVLAILAAGSGLTSAAERLDGPIEAVVERVIDGDTFTVRARIWLGQDVVVNVRPRGIDAPELRAPCALERQRGEAARAYLEGLIGGRTVTLTAVENDKYAGRIDADVRLGSVDVAQRMIESGHAVRYDGRHRDSACAPPHS